MQHDYAPITISSLEHLKQFADIQRKNPWWKLVLHLNKVPPGYPQVHINGTAVPVNFFAKGQLRLFERQMDFHARAPNFDNGMRYTHVNTDFQFDLPYSAITRVGRYELAEPFIKRFNVTWVSIQVDAPGVPSELLLSSTGSGTQMHLIKQTNDELYEKLQAKVSSR